MEYVYIIHTREFINSDQNIFKVGRTNQEHTKRLAQYPKGSILKIQKHVNDSKAIEKQLISHFCNIFKQRTDIGSEYFECNDYNDIEREFLNVIHGSTFHRPTLPTTIIPGCQCYEKTNNPNVFIRSNGYQCGVSFVDKYGNPV